MKGMIFNIQRFCVQDGPGIRTTVFFKGCPLRCAWCHNPESHRRQAEILYSPEKCVMCGGCAAVCPKELHRVDAGGHAYDRGACDGCGACAAVCPAGALELCGREAEADEVLSGVMRDLDFYRASGGGLTLSGGEPMAQPAFALALARGARAADVGVCLETCGCCAREDLAHMLPYVELFLFDFKLADGAAHRRWTGADNALILQNLAFLGESGARIILRCPIIPGVNFTTAHFEAVARLAASNRGVCQIDLEPYHPLGVEKARRLGRAAGFEEETFLERAQLENDARRLREAAGVPVSIL